MSFFIIPVNLFRKALLWRWEIPKYCSTIYRTLEMALLRSFSNFVNSVPRTAFLVMPSAILFRWRESLLFFRKIHFVGTHLADGLFGMTTARDAKSKIWAVVMGSAGYFRSQDKPLTGIDGGMSLKP